MCIEAGERSSGDERKVPVMTQIGEQLPPFNLPNQDGKPVDSGDLRGTWFLMYWYPKADTPGCTAQAEGLRDQLETFTELGCVVLGASFDRPELNKVFRQKYRLNFGLLSDVDHAVAVDHGVVDDPTDAFPRRISHLVGPDGVVVRLYEVETPEFFAEAVLDDLEEAMGK